MGFVMSFIKIRDQPMGRQVCLTMPFSRSGVAAANVGIGNIAVAETLAKKYRLFMWCLMLLKSD